MSSPGPNFVGKLLETYIVRAYSENYPSSTRSLFHRTPSPRLRKDCINRALLYQGCFKPPHVAHLSFVRYVFLRAQEHFNAVAVIVVPLSDASCMRKLDHEDKKSLLFSYVERRRLWEKDPEFPEWACVIDRDSRRDDIDPSLQYRAKKGGFEIQLVNIIGPDHIKITETPKYYWNETITSDVSRLADFVAGNRLLTLKKCPKWQTWLFGAINGTSKEYLQGLCQWYTREKQDQRYSTLYSRLP